MMRRQFLAGATASLVACRGAATSPARAPTPIDARPVIGLEAALGELRQLRAALEGSLAHVLTTRGSDHLEQTEWPFFAILFYADAATRFASLPRMAPSRRDALVAEARWALARGHATGIHGALPLLPDGHLLLALERFAHVNGDGEYRDLRERLAHGLEEAFERSATGILPSYPSVWWTLDAVPALAALALRGSGAAARARWETTVRASAIDPATGLIIAGWNPARGKAIGPPRGCAVMLASPDLQVVSTELAREQWACARTHLVRTVSGLTGVREYPEPLDLPPSTDSGRIFMGLGEAASGFGLAAAAAAGDLDLLAALLRSARRVAPPTWNGDRLALPNVPPVGQAALLRAKVWNAEAAAVASLA